MKSELAQGSSGRPVTDSSTGNNFSPHKRNLTYPNRSDFVLLNSIIAEDLLNTPEVKWSIVQ